jgi:hypothetical protein
VTETEDIEVIDSEVGAGLFRRQRKTITSTPLNNRGRKWLRDQLGLGLVISGIGLLSGFSFETWLGINLLSIPVTVYYARNRYQPLSEDLREGDEEEQYAGEQEE